MLTTLGISNYRSLRDLVIPLKHLNVITGPNGSGKSNLYRALRLLADTAQSRIITSVAREGGLQSTLWAGPESLSRDRRRGEQPVQGTRRKHPVCLRLGFASDQFGYLIDMGLPQPGSSAFGLDPEIKRELIWHGSIPRPSTTLVDRNHCAVRVRDSEKGWNVVTHNLATFDSMMTHIADPRSAPETLSLRESIRAWRFYDHFRTDHASPARVPQVGTRTPVLADDGADLAAAMQTIREIADSAALDSAVADAFPAARVRIDVDSGRFTLAMEQHGMLRPLQASELSDGTLRYLLWVAALLTPRPPSLIVLNEPETSLHPDLLEALGRLIGQASRRSQVIVVTHSAALLSSLAHESEYHPITLEKKLGETSIVGMRDLDRPEWRWPAR
jgi:predicted ATPase